MRTLTEGHKYEVFNFENPLAAGQHGGKQTIQFIHKEKRSEHNPELVTVSDGTTNEELLRVLIDRMQYLQGKFPCRENALVITKLEESLMWLEKRTVDRQLRGVEGKHLK